MEITDKDRMDFIEKNNIPMEEVRIANGEKRFGFFNGRFSKPFKYGRTIREAIDNAILYRKGKADEDNR